LRLHFDPKSEERELREYLGDGYDHDRLQHYHEELEEEVERIGDEATLYRTSEAYLYNLTAFAMTGTKEPYLGALIRAVKPPARVLDYGCGIGSDGLRLLEAGYRSEFADFANPSTRYLRWRLQRRGLSAPIHDLDAGPAPSGFELAYAFDVIEHVDDAFGFLGTLERSARLVLVNFLEPEPDETTLHRALPVADLLRHAVGHGIRHYARHYGRSHLVLYEPGARPKVPAAVAARRAARRLGSGAVTREDTPTGPSAGRS
jgi:SAM-dependent methyltransferase